MPHFIIDCSAEIIDQKSPEQIMQAVYETAEATGLFAKNDIKVRLNPYKYYKLGNSKKDFISHIWQHYGRQEYGTKSKSFQADC